MRHSYAAAGRDAKIDWKALSQRIGHADVAFTMKQYVQTDLEADRQVANTLAQLISGGSLASIEIADERRRCLSGGIGPIMASEAVDRPTLETRSSRDWPLITCLIA